MSKRKSLQFPIGKKEKKNLLAVIVHDRDSDNLEGMPDAGAGNCVSRNYIVREKGNIYISLNGPDLITIGISKRCDAHMRD